MQLRMPPSVGMLVLLASVPLAIGCPSSSTCEGDACADGSSGGGSSGSGSTSTTPNDTTGGGADSSGGGGSGSGDSTGGPAACPPQSHQCIAAAPEGWAGPVVAQTGMGLIECQGGYADSVLDVPIAPIADPTECDCQCGDETGGGCVGADVKRGASPACVNQPSSALAPGVCDNIIDTSSDYWGFYPIHNPGTCPPVPTETFPEVTFSDQVRLCAGAVLEDVACEAGEVCAPLAAAPWSGNTCIWAEGEQPCPDGPFSEQTVHYRGFEDTRAYYTCTCGTPTSDCSGWELQLWPTDTCTVSMDTVGTVMTPDTCTDVSGQSLSTTRAVRISGTAAVGTCEPGAFSPTGTGEVTPADPVTVCCTP